MASAIAAMVVNLYPCAFGIAVVEIMRCREFQFYLHGVLNDKQLGFLKIVHRVVVQNHLVLIVADESEMNLSQSAVSANRDKIFISDSSATMRTKWFCT